MTTSSPESKSTLLEKVKDFFSPDNLAERFHLTKGRLLEMAVYLLVGFVVGYLLKKYSKFVFIVAMVCLVLLVLQQLDLIALGINWAKIQSLIGIQTAVPTDGNFLNAVWAWGTINVALVISFLLGFLLGLRLG